MSMMDPPVSQTEESLLWNGIHPPSEVYSPPAPPRTYRIGIATSPMSNLALHPHFRSPGDDFPDDHYSAKTEDQYKDQSTSRSFDESNLSEANMRDIHAQHAGLQGYEIHNGNAEIPQEAETKTANGPNEDEPGSNQAPPVDGSAANDKHEGL